MLPLETKFEWEHISDDTRVAVTPIKSNDRAKYYRITVDYPNRQFPEPIKLYWFTEFNDAFSSWTPLGQFRREIMPSWRAIDTHSRSAAGAPVYSMMAKNGENRYTFSLADAACPIRLTGGMEERNGKIKCTVEFFTNRVDMMNHYETILRIDDSNQPWYDALYDVRQCWISLGYTPAHVPYDAKNTMFSSWYYSQVLATRDDCVIAALYSDSLLVIPHNTNICIAVNATGNTQVYVENTIEDTQKKCTIQNCMGDVLSCNTINLKTGVTKFEVPHNGFLYLE